MRTRSEAQAFLSELEVIELGPSGYGQVLQALADSVSQSRRTGDKTLHFERLQSDSKIRQYLASEATYRDMDYIWNDTLGSRWAPLLCQHGNDVVFSRASSKCRNGLFRRGPRMGTIQGYHKTMGR